MVYHILYIGTLRNILYFYQILFNGNLDELCDRRDIQFFHDVILVCFRGLGTDAQAF